MQIIGPLLAILLATPSRLVVSVVPNHLVLFSKKSFERRFAAVLRRPVLAFEFNRYMTARADMLEDVRNIQEMKGVLICSPTTVKSIYLKFIFLLAILWDEPFMREDQSNSSHNSTHRTCVFHIKSPSDARTAEA